MNRFFNIYDDSFEHLDKNDMTYSEHFHFSLCLTSSLFFASIKSFIHTIVPAFFSTATSDFSASLNRMLEDRKNN